MRLRYHPLRPPARLAALAAAVAATLVATIVAAPPATADTTVLANDFESGSYAPWGPRGDVTLAIAEEGRDSAASLSVTGRTADWQGPATSATDLFSPGVVHSVTAWVKLPAGTEGAAGVHFTVAATPADGGDDTYTWIGDAAETTADTWVRIGGEYTMPTGLTSATLYVEAAGTTPFLLDDVLVTSPDETPGVVTVSAVDFEDGTTGTWSASGGPTLTVVDTENGRALRVSDRVEGFDGLQSPAGIFTAGVTHTFSARVRLAPDGPASSGFRFVMKPDYDWIGNTTVTADDWTTVTGEFTVPADADPATYQVYLEAAEATATYLVDDILITAPDTGPGGPPPGTVVIDSDFEDGLDGWVPRDGGPGAPTVELTGVAHGGEAAALVTDRVNQGAGIGRDVTTAFEPGVGYELSGWLRFAQGQPTDDIWLSIAATTADGSQSFSTLAQFDTVTDDGWTEVTASFTAPTFTSAFLYFETSWQGADVTGNTSDFLLDDVVVRVPEPPVVEDLTGIHETTDFPVGVAIDSRETVGSAAELLTRHFTNITPENHMKPEAWYDADRNFRPHEQAIAMMDFAQTNEIGVYGHVLVWHSQTPEWMFQDADGEPLSSSAADQQVLRDRLRGHIFAVAESLSDRYGRFGSDTNPLNAFDVVNEVVSDSGEYADGLRRSEWYRILGEEFIDLSFQYADEAFNDVYAVTDTDPVALFINDYNTEQSGKQARYHALVERLLDRGAPVDGVGHQFHVSLSTPVGSLETTLERFAGLPVVQAVTELDVTIGTPVTQANLIEQGYFLRDAFRIFRAYSEELAVVTVWGLTDGRSWRSDSGAPLLFDDGYQAKPAYYGAVDAELPARLRIANVFAGDVALSPGATSDLAWRKLPLHPVEETAGFQLRWSADRLTAYVSVTDPAVSSDDRVEFVLDGETYPVARDGSGDVPAVATERDGGYAVVAQLPLTDPAEGGTVPFDVRVTDDDATTGWATAGTVGTLTLVEELSYLEVVRTPSAPAIDGTVDPGWSHANQVTTAKQVSGTDGAVATVRTLWQDQTLYVLAEVADPVVDVTGSDPWTQDSVEIYVDAGNAKNGPYRYDDTQIRINADNVVSFGTGDEAFQAGRLTSAVVRTDTGYTVEAAISLLEYGGLDTFHGLDFQVNDAADGARTAIRNWAEQNGVGYQTTARWGVGRLVDGTNVDVTFEPITQWDSDSGGGYCTEIVAGNATDQPVDWRAAVELPGDVYTAWNFERESFGDGTWRITGVDWNRTLKPGARTFSVGYCATW
ncbi:endo-1,4-beta-xylanase [Solwaraspora sp. WMMD937]|uniref:endo-1,4-beta-xylanase n=1 Tax=Solwaraspora sp. WMMD937 TaxID=3016090 RepID=UPI00249CD774|nr:endo-1,4-beta-xylanase [Solwaraspora sp. WMMD937]WFE20645.1 endo-1,4-beta-xylanase [Solwaraspora sp. WMMD937]